MEVCQNDIFFSAPEVSPGDVWGDAACLDAGALVTLPPKRVKQDKPGGFGEDGDVGLRIGTRVSGRLAEEAAMPLVVQEIDGSVVRLQPEQPAVPRMPRQIVFQELSTGQDELVLAGEAHEWGRSKRQPILWILGAGAATAAVVVGSMVMLPFVNKSNAARLRPGDSEWVLEPIANAETLGNMLARQAEAEHLFRDFINARTTEDLLPLVRTPQEVVGLIREGHRPPQAANRLLPKTRAWGARENPPLTYGILAATLPDYSELEAYFVISDGRLVIDWKASTAYGTANFGQLIENKGNPAEIRGWIEPADYYTSTFPEYSFQSYRLISPDREQSIWVYARRGGELYLKLKTLLKGGYILEGRKEPEKVTVRLEVGPANSMPGQWSLVELLHKEWIAP